HVPQLELLGRDAPYLRPSNTQFTVNVSNVVVELPTVESPGTGPVVSPTISVPKGGSAKPRLRVRAKPRRVRAGHRSRITFRVRAHKRPVRRALVRFAGKRHRTGRRGRAHFTVRLHHRGIRRAVATKHGYRRGVARVRVMR
ncbi:MAG: hypothetical protein QOG63_1634, partial [Thermoleophilaceae bacterium]|nr:hypothetical protein [Thermoleophilaceae bacterium]